MKIWFTSDTHFNHANIIKYCNRPFASVGEMNVALIAKWQEAVAPYDTIFHLGDVAMGDKEASFDILPNLPGKKILIRGNHDSKLMADADIWESVHDYYELKHMGKQYVLCHYPFAVWNRSHHGAINLHGHSHGTFKGNSQQLDVGVDVHNYKPISFEEIEAALAKQQSIKPKDHHGVRL